MSIEKEIFLSIDKNFTLMNTENTCWNKVFCFILLFHDEDHYHIESSPLICFANQVIRHGLRHERVKLHFRLCYF